MAVTARIAVLFSVVSYLLVLSAASRVAVFPSHEDDGPLSLPSDEKRTTEVSLPAIDAEGFQQVDLTLRRPVDVRHLHHVHLRGLELAEADDVRDHHPHHHPHHHHGHDHDHHHHHHHHHEGFVIPYGDDMLMGENSMPRKGEGFEMEAAERDAVEELKEWNPVSVDWEQAPEERRGNRKVKCEHKKKRFEDEDSDSDDEDDDEMEMRKKELKRMRRKMRKEKPPMREEGGWMEWFSGVWNGF